MLFPPMLDQDDGDELDGEDFVDMVNPETWFDWIVYQKSPDQQDTIADKWEKLHPGE